ncbi:MAG: MATE family efflux transporter [Lachnospiraceae bacterium]|nr:MATE family efflux transporter [Lachnospiraceae bacterium]
MAHSEEKLGTEKIGRLIWSMGIPTLIAQVINLLYNIVDRMYIGHLVGPEALTGVGLTLPVIMLISAFSAFVGAGGAPLAAIAMGQGDKKRAETILSNAVTMLCFFTVALMLLFFCIEKPFLYLIGASDVTYPFAGAYLRIYLLGTLFVQIVIGLNPFITAQGQSKIAMLSVLIGAVLNIALDPVFIFVFKMGVRGAALATIISQFASALWTIGFLSSKKTSLRIHMEYLKPDMKIIGSVAALGVSPFIMQSTESLISVVLSSGLQKYGGDVYVGSLTILQSVMQLINTPISGFTQGVQPILSYNYGAGNIERVKKTYKRIIGITVAASFCITLSAMLLPGMYARIFTDDVELIGVVRRVMPVFVAGMLIFGIQMGCQTTFMGLGQAKISLFMALLRKVFLLVPFAIIFPLVTKNVMSIYYAECSADAIAAIVCGTVFLCNIKKILARGPAGIKS